MFIYEIGVLTFFAKQNQLYRAIEWRDTLNKWCNDNNIRFFNPVETWNKEKNHTYSDKMIVDQNDYYINKADIAVVSLDSIDHSPGSIYELCRFKELRKPVIAFGKPNLNPHINSCISERVDTINDVIELLCNEFSQENF
jgi:nucleoside 2-deoxyribosyltransferase